MANVLMDTHGKSSFILCKGTSLFVVVISANPTPLNLAINGS
jgi:hypothetical protein